MKNFKRYAAFFLIGGAGYALIELLWRGRTHWTMVLSGGISFMLFSYITVIFADNSLLLKAALSALSVTVVELVFGVVFNVILGMKVWDYSNVPFNFLGQICPRFTLMWGGLALIFVPIAEMLNRKLGVLPSVQKESLIP